MSAALSPLSLFPEPLREEGLAVGFRLVTYNIHSCVGSDGRVSLQRIADVIRELNPQIVALQEVDVGQARSGREDQAAWLARHTGMTSVFSSARPHDGGHYGNAILSTFPLEPVREGHLPSRSSRRPLEPRIAQWVKLQVGAESLHLVNTHLSLDRRERGQQAQALLSSEWIDHPQCAEPLVVCGDFNSLPGSFVVRAMRRRLRDAERCQPRFWSSTFPSCFPLVRLDYVFASPRVAVSSARTRWTRATRRASDHLPLVVDMALPFRGQDVDAHG